MGKGRHRSLGAGLGASLTAIALLILTGCGGGGAPGADNTGVTQSVTCNTSLFSGGVRDATNVELMTYDQTYTGNTGSYDLSFNFVPSGAATLVFGASGSLSYNSQAQTVASICYESAVPQLVVHFGADGHVDFKTDGSFTGVAPDGTTVIKSGSAPAGTAPAAPTGVAATAASSTQINVGWTAVSGATSYNIYRSTSPSVQITSGNKINTGTVAASTYSDTGLTASTTYYYKVTAVNADGESAGSTEVSAATQAGGGAGGGSYTPPNDLGSLAASGAGAAQFGNSFAPTTLASVDYFGLSWQYKWEISSTLHVQTSGSTVTITNGNPIWQKPLAPLDQLSYDATTGTITFTNLTTTTALGGASGPLILNGTLYIAPLNSGPVSLSGTGTIYTGTGFDAPVAVFAATATTETWTWIDMRGTRLKLTHVLTNGNYQLQMTGLGDTPFLSSIASLATLGIAIDSNAKTVTFTDTAATNNSTGTSVLLSGTLSIP
ncbi:MAG: fibronectin type III domain-containing protein [Sideroxyarcus sp.]|nr:fibronectin type III domain-containing protein [Sideroxyarcus sp.]